MRHTPESTTHWACKERMKRYGKKAICCQCSGHKCYERFCSWCGKIEYTETCQSESIQRAVKPLADYMRHSMRSGIDED